MMIFLHNKCVVQVLLLTLFSSLTVTQPTSGNQTVHLSYTWGRDTLELKIKHILNMNASMQSTLKAFAICAQNTEAVSKKIPNKICVSEMHITLTN